VRDVCRQEARRRQRRQIFSRLNRPMPGKTTFILDFVNDVETLRDTYADY
jgi:type I site-specific restriction-modification system R (restriction) subunit